MVGVLAKGKCPNPFAIVWGGPIESTHGFVQGYVCKGFPRLQVVGVIVVGGGEPIFSLSV